MPLCLGHLATFSWFRDCRHVDRRRREPLLSWPGPFPRRYSWCQVKRGPAMRPDRVDINTSAKQVGCGCMANRMRAYTFGFERRDFPRRAFCVTRHERMDSKSCYGIAISIEEQGIGGVPSSDERLEFSHCLFPKWAEPNLPAFSTDLHRASACCVPSQIVDHDLRGLGGSGARVVEKQEQGVVSLAVLSRPIWSVKKFVDLIFFQIQNRSLPCSFEGNPTDMHAPIHVLWARLACEPSKGVERREAEL